MFLCTRLSLGGFSYLGKHISVSILNHTFGILSLFFKDCTAHPAAPSCCWPTGSETHMPSSCVHVCVAFAPGRKDNIAVPLRWFRPQASPTLQETLRIDMAHSTIFPLLSLRQLRKVRPIFFCQWFLRGHVDSSSYSFPSRSCINFCLF